ncbi:MAG: hypothetical protein ACR5K9_07145 [Wolbachia sp.]
MNNEQISVNYQNLELILKISTLIKELDKKLPDKIISADETISPDEITSLQGKMKTKLEEMQQQQSPQSPTSQGNDVNKYSDDVNKNESYELEKKANAEFGKYIENGAIDSTSIAKTESGDLYATIELNDNGSTSVKISEFLNSKFCTENNIAGFSILNSDKEKVISGHVDNKGVRYYDLSTMAQYGIKFNWYVGERECSITLSVNGDGSIKIVGNRPADADLKENEDLRIKVGDRYLSLVDAVVSSKLDQSSVNQLDRQIRCGR